MTTTLSAAKFAVLFCITLRTYFDWLSDSDLDNAFLEYEKKFGFISDPKIINKENIELRLLSVWEMIHKKLKSRYYSDLEEAIRQLGKTDDSKGMEQYLFFPLWCPPNLLLTAETQAGTCRTSGQVLIQVNSKGIESLCETAKSTNNESSAICFKRMCYQWIMSK